MTEVSRRPGRQIQLILLRRRMARAAHRASADMTCSARLEVVPPALKTYPERSLPLILAEVQEAGLTAEQTAYVLATAQHESNFGKDMEEKWELTREQRGCEGKAGLSDFLPPPQGEGLPSGREILPGYTAGFSPAEGTITDNRGDGYRYRGRGYV